jgi:hypothetical protein
MHKNVSTFTDKHIYEFLVNDDFINYVINPSPALEKQWNQFFGSNPQLQSAATEARSILCGADITNNPLQQSEYEKIKGNILAKIV